MVFGINSSPFGQQFVPRVHVKKYIEVLPLVASAVWESTYMDNTMVSLTDNKTGSKLYCEMSTIWQSAWMHVKNSFITQQKPVKSYKNVDNIDITLAWPNMVNMKEMD